MILSLFSFFSFVNSSLPGAAVRRMPYYWIATVGDEQGDHVSVAVFDDGRYWGRCVLNGVVVASHMTRDEPCGPQAPTPPSKKTIKEIVARDPARLWYAVDCAVTGYERALAENAIAWPMWSADVAHGHACIAGARAATSAWISLGFDPPLYAASNLMDLIGDELRERYKVAAD